MCAPGEGGELRAAVIRPEYKVELPTSCFEEEEEESEKVEANDDFNSEEEEKEVRRPCPSPSLR
jgi:hypothetical protein